MYNIDTTLYTIFHVTEPAYYVFSIGRVSNTKPRSTPTERVARRVERANVVRWGEENDSKDTVRRGFRFRVTSVV